MGVLAKAHTEWGFPPFSRSPYPFSPQEISLPPPFYGKKSNRSPSRDTDGGGVCACAEPLVCGGGRARRGKSTSPATPSSVRATVPFLRVRRFLLQQALSSQRPWLIASQGLGGTSLMPPRFQAGYR